MSTWIEIKIFLEIFLKAESNNLLLCDTCPERRTISRWRLISSSLLTAHTCPTRCSKVIKTLTYSEGICWRGGKKYKLYEAKQMYGTVLHKQGKGWRCVCVWFSHFICVIAYNCVVILSLCVVLFHLLRADRLCYLYILFFHSLRIYMTHCV